MNIDGSFISSQPVQEIQKLVEENEELSKRINQISFAVPKPQLSTSDLSDLSSLEAQRLKLLNSTPSIDNILLRKIFNVVSMT